MFPPSAELRSGNLIPLDEKSAARGSDACKSFLVGCSSTRRRPYIVNDRWSQEKNRRDGPAPQNRKIGPIAISPCETTVAFKCTTQPAPQTNELTSGLITSGNHSACVLKPMWRLK
jgi:hypothetical protein